MSVPKEAAPAEIKGARQLTLLSCIAFIFIVGAICILQGSWKVDDQYDYDDVIMLITRQHPACPFPQLDPFDKSIEPLLDHGSPPTLDCEKKYPLLFKSTLESTLIPVNESVFVRGNYASCCYRTMERDDKSPIPDDKERTSDTCFPLSFTIPTKIPEGHEFIGIYCRRNGGNDREPVDAHAFIHLKPTKWDQGSVTRDDKLNVIMFGLDATSRMNFIRAMPKSYAFLKGEMGGVEMLGYNKVEENTFPNVMAMLTSRHAKELNCTFGHRFSNECPFIWKEYSKQGYYTLLAEDATYTGIFNMNRQGFYHPPTDYYLRPLSHWANKNVASARLINADACYGPRLTFQYLLDYMEKFVDGMSRSRNNFFQFTWSTALTHDYQSTGQYGDFYLLNSLKWLKNSGHLNNTVLILLGDHGYRFGQFRQTIQGQLEDRLPLLFFVLPDFFKKKYRRAYKNFLTNRDKLVTPFDIHATLQDILNPKDIKGYSMRRRELLANSASRTFSLTRHLSLFLPIPESRTCEMAGIDQIFCSCTYLTLVPLGTPVIKDVGRVAVSHLNSMLSTEPRCAQLQLKNVTMAQQTGKSSINWEAYLINFETEPGGGQFEAMIGKAEGDTNWSVQDKITRTSLYGNQSHCVKNIELKSYCYCLAFNEVL